MINVFDNFIDENSMKEIENLMLNSFFPWYYNDGIKYENEEDPWIFQFTHIFYDNFSPRSEYFNILNPIIEKINPKSLIRIKANLGTINKNKKRGGFHIDYDYGTTAVFYVNSNNGYTEFENGRIVESRRNRFASFDANTKHSGVSQTDSKLRCLINFNYME